MFRSSRGLRLVRSPTKPRVILLSGDGGGEGEGVAGIGGRGVAVAGDAGGKVWVGVVVGVLAGPEVTVAVETTSDVP